MNWEFKASLRGTSRVMLSPSTKSTTQWCDHAARADPDLQLVVTDERVHAHEMNPFGGYRLEHQHAIAGMEGRSAANPKSTGAGWHIGVEDRSGRTFPRQVPAPWISRKRCVCRLVDTGASSPRSTTRCA